MGEKLSDLLADWLLDLAASRKSPKTLTCYSLSVRSYIASGGDDAAGLHRRAIRHWLAGMAESGQAPATQQLRFTVLDIYCAWLVAEGVITSNPMAG
jgi:site-specific recombinase XerC